MCGSGRSELALVGKAGVREVLATAWGGAARVREHRAHGNLSRRGQGWSRASNSFSARKLPTTVAAATGRYSSSSCAFWRRRERVCRVARQWGEARLVGAWRMVALWLLLAINGVDKGACGTGSGGCN